MQVNTRNMLSDHVNNIQFSYAIFLIIESSKMKNELLQSEIIQRNLLTGMSDSWHALHCSRQCWVNWLTGDSVVLLIVLTCVVLACTHLSVMCWVLAVVWRMTGTVTEFSQIIPSNLLTGMSECWQKIICWLSEISNELVTVRSFPATCWQKCLIVEMHCTIED